MEKWEHMLVATEKSGNVSQLVAVGATGTRQTVHSTGAVAVLTLLDELGREGWQLVSVDDGIHWLKRQLPDRPGGGWIAGA
jgi:hypothetical protein